MKSVRISVRAARELLAMSEGRGSAPHGAYELSKALEVKPTDRAARKARTAKRLSHNEETAVIRAAVIARAKGRCECGCGRHILTGTGQMDHYAGRVRQRQSIEWCWWLSRECHRAKTDNKPDAMTWHFAFLKHARAHRYTAPAAYALNHIEAEELLRKAEEGRRP